MILVTMTLFSRSPFDKMLVCPPITRIQIKLGWLYNLDDLIKVWYIIRMGVAGDWFWWPWPCFQGHLVKFDQMFVCPLSHEFRPNLVDCIIGLVLVTLNLFSKVIRNIRLSELYTKKQVWTCLLNCEIDSDQTWCIVYLE